MSQNGADHASAGTGSADLAALRERMAVIKNEVIAQVEEKWVTPYRTPAVFDLKVNARLAAHEEYRRLQQQVREAEAAARSAQSDPGSGD